MFDQHSAPHVFGLAPGVDFPAALVAGLVHRMQGKPPEEMARLHLIVNTSRMQRRIQSLFEDRGPAVLPKVLLLTQLDMLEPTIMLPPAISPLRRRLELVSLVERLIEQQEDLAPRAALYDLTDSLAALMDEMQGEGVTAEVIAKLDVSDQSGHWQRAQAFIRIAQSFLDRTAPEPDKEARQRQLVEALRAHWQVQPPKHPVILAGSTGSRGTTLLLMETIARLRQGAIVLPGYDFDMPAKQWLDLDDAMLSEDHPQYRFHKLTQKLGLADREIRHWHLQDPAAPDRNALISLALRPAPVTHAWRNEGPRLKALDTATQRMTLLEAPNPRIEALTIAMRLRKAVEEGQCAAVITPDRMLTRQITAALDQWDIVPDDSAGAPLHLSPPGRFLRHTASLFHRRLDAEALLTMLKHPLTHSAGARGDHALNTQRLELRIRDKGLPYPDATGIAQLLARSTSDADAQAKIDQWSAWAGVTFADRLCTRKRHLEDWVAMHIELAETIARGTHGADSGELWQKNAGQEALNVMQTLREQAEFGSDMTASDYANLVGSLLSEGEVRDRDAPHPDVMIWGTLEARVQGADLVILAGLNDGTWPEAPAPDPWLNRALRKSAGLLLPERRVGLSAHDFQQAVAAPEVWITRSIRSEDAETVPSRWINRLCNLLEGLKGQAGPALLQAMRNRGRDWLEKAALFEAVAETPPARRPAPRPPVNSRPTQMPVTDIKRLIRDPYAIYAKHVLRLRKLGPLVQTADALERGIVSHDALEVFVRETLKDPGHLKPDAFVETARAVLTNDVPWPAARALWLARFERIADWFVGREHSRQKLAIPMAFEDDAKGRLYWSDINFALTARADRIDRAADGSLYLYDYKTGRAPSKPEQKHFDKQLLIEAAMLEEGAFESIGAAPVAAATFISLASNPDEVSAPMDEEPPIEVLARLRQLIVSYQDPAQGFTARRMMQKDSHGSDYDLLARYGEWDETEDPVPEDLS